MADREGLPPCERRSSGAALMRGARKRNAAERTEVPVGRHPPNYAFTGSARLLVASENTWRTESSYCTTAGRCGENWRTERDERSAGVIRRITALPSGSDCQSLLSPLPGRYPSRVAQKTSTRQHARPAIAFNGGQRGIRTLEGLLTLTPLAGVRLRPLGHLSALAGKAR
jgi:hypothetical protein